MKLTVALRETTAGTGNIGISVRKPPLTSPTNDRNSDHELKAIAILIVTGGMISHSALEEQRLQP